jgi:hypothetical protein
VSQPAWICFSFLPSFLSSSPPSFFLPIFFGVPFASQICGLVSDITGENSVSLSLHTLLIFLCLLLLEPHYVVVSQSLNIPIKFLCSFFFSFSFSFRSVYCHLKLGNPLFIPVPSTDKSIGGILPFLIPTLLFYAVLEFPSLCLHTIPSCILSTCSFKSLDFWLLGRLRSGRLRSGRFAQANSSLDPHLQNKQSKMDWRSGSSGRGPALQVQSPEFKPQSYQKICIYIFS